MVESKDEDSDKAPQSVEKKETGKGTCLYVSLAKSADSTTIISKKLESLGFEVNKECNIATATQLCSSTRMALIVLEDCDENKFIAAIKKPNACNEHTPILFISSGPLSDTVRHLMQEQYIDELVFNCLTLECDLGSAVNRLITQPGQFAVTPKSKRPGIVRKRKLETASPSSRNKESKEAAGSPKDWQIPPSTGDLPLISPFLHDCDNVQSAYHMNPLLMPIPPMQHQGYYQQKSGLPHPAEQMSHGGSYNTQLPPCPPLSYYPHVANERSNVYVKGEGGITHCNIGNTVMSTGHSRSDQWRPSVITKAGSKEQSVNGVPKDVTSEENTVPGKNCEETSLDSKEKHIQPGERKKTPKTKADKADKRIPERNVDAGSGSSSSDKKGDIPGRKRTGRKSSGLTSVERKEQHLDKEKKRRERITKSWHWLRQLVPNCDPYADKATVFEMSVAYLHHCWKHHGPLVQQINKDFSSLNKISISLEEMEKSVMEVLENERKASGNSGLQS